MPYFEGDFWPNILEESIKEIEQEELEKRRREEEEAAADTDDGESSVHGDRVEVSHSSSKLFVHLLGSLVYSFICLYFIYANESLTSKKAIVIVFNFAK